MKNNQIETNIFSLLSDEINQKLSSLNITTPTKVQTEIIPQILEGKNVIFQSETGTGKTFAYLLPLINKLEKKEELKEKLMKEFSAFQAE